MDPRFVSHGAKSVIRMCDKLGFGFAHVLVPPEELERALSVTHKRCMVEVRVSVAF